MAFDWAKAASLLLKAEITRADITLAQLTVRLKALGVAETEAALKQKLYRGTFSLALFLQCMQALDVDAVHVKGVLPADRPRGKQLDT